VLRPGARLAITVRRRSHGIYLDFTAGTLRALLLTAGFANPYVHDGPDPRHPLLCATARVPLDQSLPTLHPSL